MQVMATASLQGLHLDSSTRPRNEPEQRRVAVHVDGDAIHPFTCGYIGPAGAVGVLHNLGTRLMVLASYMDSISPASTSGLTTLDGR